MSDNFKSAWLWMLWGGTATLAILWGTGQLPFPDGVFVIVGMVVGIVIIAVGHWFSGQGRRA